MNRKTNIIEKGKAFEGHSILLIHILIAVSVTVIIAKTTDAQSNHFQTIMTIPQTVKPLDAPEVFGPDNLYEKINGQAEFYLSSGFVRLESQWFEEKENIDSIFEVYIYHMGDELNAVSVYSEQRTDGAQQADLSQFAYQTKNSLYLVHGPYYVEMISANPSARILSKMASLARHFIKDRPVEATSIKELRFFPKESLDQDSVSLKPKNAFGFDGLDRVFTATYNIRGGKVTAFVSKRKTPQEAKDLTIDFYKYFIAFGGKKIHPDVSIKDARMIEIMDTYTIMFPFESYVAGVHEASTRRQAAELAYAFVTTLREMLDT